VYLCKNHKTSDNFAVKEIGLDRIKDPVSFLKELAITKRLDHENVIKFKTAFRDNNVFCLVMDYLEGGDLHLLLKRNPRGVSSTMAADFFQMMLSAVSYLHHHRLCHRDIKAENFMMKSKNHHIPIKLIDFGASHRFHKGELMHTTVGTPYSMAPEIMMAKPYSERVDVWSAGCVSCELCVGHAPYTAETRRELVSMVKKEHVEYGQKEWRRHPTWLLTLTKQMLSRDPKNRPSALEILAQTLQYHASKVDVKGCCIIS